jgi:hypothetical protein
LVQPRPVHVINPLKGIAMRRALALLAGVAMIAVSMSSPGFSQGAPRTLSMMKIDPRSPANGYRTSKILGSAVVNEANETVGTIDDLIVTPSETMPYAVLSVAGFLGMGTKYVMVPYSALEVNDKRMLLRGATKESLKSLPKFKYNP